MQTMPQNYMSVESSTLNSQVYGKKRLHCEQVPDMQQIASGAAAIVSETLPPDSVHTNIPTQTHRKTVQRTNEPR
jgi:hypothetical protein